MTYFEDMSLCTYWRKSIFRILPIAVGWLEGDHCFTKGKIPSHTFKKLCDLLVHNWELSSFTFRGFHICSICKILNNSINNNNSYSLFEYDPTSLDVYKRRRVSMGVSNLFIPSAQRDVLFVAPSLIIHYIFDHQYLPPKSFLEAIDACPQMGSFEYLAAIEPFWNQEDEYVEEGFLESYFEAVTLARRQCDR